MTQQLVHNIAPAGGSSSGAAIGNESDPSTQRAREAFTNTIRQACPFLSPATLAQVPMKPLVEMYLASCGQATAVVNDSMPGRASAVTDGDMLRLATAVQTLFRGASPETVAALGESTLKSLQKHFEKANAIAPTATNSAGLGEFAGYSINAMLLPGQVSDKLRQAFARTDAEYAGYDDGVSGR